MIKPPDKVTALFLRNLSFKITESELEREFKRFNLVPNKTKIQYDRCGRLTGCAALLFQSQSDADRAKKAKNKQNLLNRRMEIDEMDFEDYEALEVFEKARIVCNSKLTP